MAKSRTCCSVLGVWAVLMECLILAIVHWRSLLLWSIFKSHYETWTPDSGLDHGLDSGSLDSIMGSLHFRSSGVKGYSATKLWSGCCKLEGLIISTLQNYRRDNHFRWYSNLAQSLCFLKTRWVLVCKIYFTTGQNCHEMDMDFPGKYRKLMKCPWKVVSCVFHGP